MFDPNKVTRLNIPQWEAVFRAEVMPGVISYIAVHDTTRGCALGGCRMAKYDNEAQALTDVLRLSRGMTYKNTVSDLPLGGGKAIIICDPKVKGVKRKNILKEFGRFVAWVNHDKPCYNTAEDMNTSVDDMNIVKEYTKNIYGTTIDPSPYTAYGIFTAIEFAVDYFAMDLFDGERDLKGKKILVQGIGKVGLDLLPYLFESGMKVYISDIRADTVKSTLKAFPSAKVVDHKDIYTAKVDIFTPSAKGEVISHQNVNKIKYKIICGPANNQLQNPIIGEILHKKGIVYCPDYIANMGGVCSIEYLEIEKLSHEETLKKIRRTVRKMLGLTFRTAFRNNLSFNVAVDHAVNKIIWKYHEDHSEFSNKKIFPLTASAELDD